MVVKKTKRAIAMIELIFALVIIGIVLLSAPMLIQQSIKSGNVALQQEAIAAVASQTAIVLSMHWDENNSNIAIGVSPLLDMNRAPFDFDLINLPLGLIGVSGRNIEDNNQTISSTTFVNFGSDANETDFSDFDDVDDYHGSNLGLTVFNTEYTSAEIGDYVDVSINMNTQINYTEDRITTGDDSNLTGQDITLNNKINSTDIGVNSNIKFVKVYLTSDSNITELEKNITIVAFSCNIGTTLPQGEEK